jgi:hypothetical protein
MERPGLLRMVMTEGWDRRKWCYDAMGEGMELSGGVVMEGTRARFLRELQARMGWSLRLRPGYLGIEDRRKDAGIATANSWSGQMVSHISSSFAFALLLTLSSSQSVYFAIISKNPPPAALAAIGSSPVTTSGSSVILDNKFLATPSCISASFSLNVPSTCMVQPRNYTSIKMSSIYCVRIIHISDHTTFR